MYSKTTIASANNKTEEYTEALHFQYDDNPENQIADDYENSEHPKWLYKKLPDDLDRDLAENLFDLGYKRTSIRKQDFSNLDSIFVCKPVEIYISTECLPIYRDILIFRKRKDVIKIVQLCFQCSKFHFIGFGSDMRSFGQNGEFKRLKALLDK